MGVRILVVDDHQILLDGLRLLLEREPNFTVVGGAGDGRSAMDGVRREKPDVVVMDLQLPDGNGIEFTRRILVEWPTTKVVVLSANPDLTRVREALQAGASGYVLKDEAADELVRAVRIVMQGKVHLSPSAATALAAGLRAKSDPDVAPAAPVLSAREMAVLKLIVDGLRNKEISERLEISTKSVETYRARIMAKLGCSSTAEIVRYAVREGIAKA